MGIEDWSYLKEAIDMHSVDRGVTAGIEAPPGGGDFVFAFNSLTLAKGGVALFANMDDFAPMAQGGSIRGCIQRGPSGGPTGFSPFFFLCCPGDSVNDSAYMLGLSDEDPCRIVLRKGAITTGIPDSDGPGVLLASGPSFAQGDWLHLRLDAIINPNGDVILRVFSNDLDSNPLGTPPDWQPVAGMDSFIDDHLGINSGSQPFSNGGRAGFGFAVSDVTRRAYFDHIELFQTEYLMELDAFRARLGISQGRIPDEERSVFVLGDIEPGRFHALIPGDHVAVTQETDLTGMDLIRTQLTVQVPSSLDASMYWEVSIVVDGAKLATTQCKSGRRRRITDLAANVSKLSGLHTVGIRLELRESL